MDRALGGPVKSKMRHDRRGHGGPPSLYGKYRPIKAERLGKSGKTTAAVLHAKERKRNRIPTVPASVADTLEFIKGCVNLDPDHAGAMMACAGGSKEDIAAAVAATKKFAPTVTQSHLSTPPPPKQTLQQMAYAAAMGTSPSKIGSAIEFGAPPRPNLPGGKPVTSGGDEWRQKCEDHIAKHGSRGVKLPNESWEDYYYYLTA
ncbi:MAG: hypothetical protein WCG99_02870 [Candidatus Berkelbacteria bacterium]